MRTVLLVLFLSFFSLTAQVKPGAKGPGKGGSSQVNNMVQTIMHDTCLTKKFSIVFYLIQDSVGSLPGNAINLAKYKLPTIISDLNNAFARICVSFEHCKTVIIPNFSFNDWTAASVGYQVISTYYTENTINVYLPSNLKKPNPDEPSVGYTPGLNTGTLSARNAVVLQRGAAGGPLLHQFGHFFGLPHTYAEIAPLNIPTPPPPSGIYTYEYVDRTNYQNCYEHGDGFCDTEADPFAYPTFAQIANPWASDFNCGVMGYVDGKGTFYTPPTDNYMSIYPCRCRFSQEQYNFMARYIVKNRMYLH